MRVLGIDPGASGALVVLSSDRAMLKVLDMPTAPIKVAGKMRNKPSPALIVDALRSLPSFDHAYVEQVGVRPGESPVASFSFGEGVGALLGALAALQIPTTRIRPQDWRRVVKVSGDKAGSRLRAAELWPGDAGLFARVKDDGRAEAALIAYAGSLLIHENLTKI